MGINPIEILTWAYKKIVTTPQKSPYRYKNIDIGWLEVCMGQARNTPRVGDGLAIMRAVRREIYEWIQSYKKRSPSDWVAYQRFHLDWKVLRVGISLQVRLLVEQVLYDEGEPWNRLVTGFLPMSWKTSGSGAPSTRPKYAGSSAARRPYHQ